MTVFEQLDIEGGSHRMRAAHATHGRLTTIGARLSQQMHSQIKFEAARRECSVASIVREAVGDWLLKNGRAS